MARTSSSALPTLLKPEPFVLAAAMAGQPAGIDVCNTQRGTTHKKVSVFSKNGGKRVFEVMGVSFCMKGRPPDGQLPCDSRRVFPEKGGGRGGAVGRGKWGRPRSP